MPTFPTDSVIRSSPLAGVQTASQQQWPASASPAASSYQGSRLPPYSKGTFVSRNLPPSSGYPLRQVQQQSSRSYVSPGGSQLQPITPPDLYSQPAFRSYGAAPNSLQISQNFASSQNSSTVYTPTSNQSFVSSAYAVRSGNAQPQVQRNLVTSSSPQNHVQIPLQEAHTAYATSFNQTGYYSNTALERNVRPPPERTPLQGVGYPQSSAGTSFAAAGGQTFHAQHQLSQNLTPSAQAVYYGHSNPSPSAAYLQPNAGVFVHHNDYNQAGTSLSGAAPAGLESMSGSKIVAAAVTGGANLRSYMTGQITTRMGPPRSVVRQDRSLQEEVIMAPPTDQLRGVERNQPVEAIVVTEKVARESRPINVEYMAREDPRTEIYKRMDVAQRNSNNGVILEEGVDGGDPTAEFSTKLTDSGPSIQKAEPSPKKLMPSEEVGETTPEEPEGQLEEIDVPGKCPPVEDRSSSSIIARAKLFPSPIKVGDCLPPAHIDLHGVCVNLQEYFADRSGILFGLLGAFHPVDTKVTVPEILSCMESFERLVDFVGCLVVNDPFAVKAWAKHLGVSDEFTFVADADAKFSEALGMLTNLSDEGLGLRCKHFALVVGPHARIRWVGFEDDARAEKVLAHLPMYVRSPWKSLLVGVAPSEEEKVEQGDDETIQSLQIMREFLGQGGFCAEPDWQICLCNAIPDVYRPTTENILSGLKWLVEGSQAGDVLAFYYCGRAGRFTDADGSERFALMPMDHAVNGVITEEDLHEILARSVPASCRLTIILDCYGQESASCPLPYTLVSGPRGCQMLGDTKSSADSPKYSDIVGEILVITMMGNGNASIGTLANALAAPEGEISEHAPPASPTTYKSKLEAVNKKLVEWNQENKSVIFASSVQLKPTDLFTMGDILCQPF